MANNKINKKQSESSLADLLEGTRDGKLVEYNPTTRKTRILLDNLFFGNGVALSLDESFVLISETFGKRISRYWLKGPKEGTSDIFCEGLPGLY